MASSYQDRLKARRGGGVKKKKSTKQLKLNEKRKIRGKTVYWNPYTKSWSKTRVFKKQPNDKNAQLRKKNVNEKSEKKLKIIRKARKEGTAPDFGDLRGTATKNQPNNGKSNKNDKPTNNGSTTTVKEKKDQPTNNGSTTTVKDKKDQPQNKETSKPKDKLYLKYRRTKGEGIGKGDTRITKKLKKAGFTETRLAKLRKEHAEFKAKRKKKKTS